MDSIIDALKEENMKLKFRVEQLEDKILRIEIAKNNHDQYTWCNNIEIQGIPATVKDEHLQNKVIDIFRCLKINIDPSDIEHCHRLGNSTPKNTLLHFVNHKFCKKALEVKFELRKINNAELHFDTSSVLYRTIVLYCSVKIKLSKISALLGSVGTEKSKINT